MRRRRRKLWEPECERDDCEPAQPLTLRTFFSGEAFLQLVAYPIIVERWESHKAGRGKRAWLATFTKAEREKIGRYYPRMRSWHLVRGTPRQVRIEMGTLQLLQRAVNFFATL